MFYRTIFLLIFFSSLLKAEEIPPQTLDTLTPTIDQMGIDASVVHGCVNVISGNYFEGAKDYSLSGPRPFAGKP